MGAQSVHKILEQEIRPVEVHVDVATDEERWALRYVEHIHSAHNLLIRSPKFGHHDFVS